MPDATSSVSNPTVGGLSGSYTPFEPLPILVAPGSGKEKNILRMELIPVACWKLNDIRFEFGSSFVLPDSKDEFEELALLRKAHPGAPLSLFGHADPVDDDVFNKPLSGRRAESVYAILTGDSARCEKLYNSAGANEGWGMRSIQLMLTAIGESPGPVTGVWNETTGYAVREFQEKHGLTMDGDPGPATRKHLFEAYAAYLSPMRLAKSDFLGKGGDEGGKADFQGCSEFNPLMVFSAAEDDEFGKPENAGKRDEENRVNRRVVGLLFRPGTEVSPAKWPCPRATEGVNGCKKRFWSDAPLRRSLQPLRREYSETKDTFACRFYDRLSQSSPCERARALLRIRLHDLLGHRMPGVAYRIAYGGREANGFADAEGFVTETLDPSIESCTLRWSPGESAPEMEWTVYVRLLNMDSEDGLRRRLQNLGYEMARSLPFNLRSFQAHRDLEITGEADEATRGKLFSIFSAALDEFEEPEDAEPATAPYDEQRT